VRRISGDLAYGDAQADVHDELRDYSEGRASLFEDSVCGCGGREFGLSVDEERGAAVRTCWRCHQETVLSGDPAHADLERCECLCAADRFELTLGSAPGWLYVGARCTACGLTGCYGDWQTSPPV
jgi:hypothetical protein